MYIAKRDNFRIALVKKRIKSKHVTPHNRLGLNAIQFLKKIYEPYTNFILFLLFKK